MYMDITIILLGAIVVVLIYILYGYVMKQSNLTDMVNLNTASGTTIAVDKLKSADSITYYLSSWIYVNSWSNITNKMLIYRGAAPSPSVGIELGTTSPTLNVKLKTTDGSGQNVVVTNNFPIQKWTHVIVSVSNGNVVDCYLDGKLVLSKQLSNNVVSDGTSHIILGSNAMDIYLTKVNRLPVAMDPQTAWNMYSSGNGLGANNSSYNIKLAVLKDNAEQSKYTLF